MRSLIIQILQPCHERWDDMHPNERGRFCASCQKTVVDYSSLSDQEIIKQLSKSSGAICGRLCDDQLNRALVSTSSRNTSTWRNWISLLTLSVVSWQSAWAQRHSTSQSTQYRTTQQPPERLSYSANPIVAHVTSKPEGNWLISGRIVTADSSGILLPVSGIDVSVNGIPSFQLYERYQAQTDSLGYFTVAVPRQQQTTQLKLWTFSRDYIGKNSQIDALPTSTNISAGDIIIRKVLPAKSISGGGLTIIQAPSPWQKVKRKLFR